MSPLEHFTAALHPSAEEYASGRALASEVLPALRQHFGMLGDSGEDHLVAGSFGKRTAIRPLPPVDLYILLPGDRQIDPLAAREEVAMALDLGPSALADGWRVTAPLPGGLVAIAPCLRQGGVFLIPDPYGIGWRVSNPAAEIAAFRVMDQVQGGRLHRLLALVKAWLRHGGVPLATFAAEVLTREYLAEETAPRDLPGLFSGFLSWARRRTPAEFSLPGGQGGLFVDPAWHGHGEAAYWRCVLAERLDAAGEHGPATLEWRRLFGPQVPGPDGDPLALV